MPLATTTPSVAAPVATPDAPPSPPPSSCNADSECNFVDATHCAAVPAGKATSTDGSCVCFEGSCALRPSSERISQAACKNNVDCGVDLSSGQCEPGLDFKVRYTGPTCRCAPSDNRCHLNWVEPIACTTTDDCWLETQPVLRPIKRPAKLKGRKFRPCVDGEVAPKCVKGACTLDGYMC